MIETLICEADDAILKTIKPINGSWTAAKSRRFQAGKHVVIVISGVSKKVNCFIGLTL
jgi:hypothetical protein